MCEEKPDNFALFVNFFTLGLINRKPISMKYRQSPLKLKALHASNNFFLVITHVFKGKTPFSKISENFFRILNMS